MESFHSSSTGFLSWCGLDQFLELVQSCDGVQDHETLQCPQMFSYRGWEFFIEQVLSAWLTKEHGVQLATGNSHFIPTILMGMVNAIRSTQKTILVCSSLSSKLFPMFQFTFVCMCLCACLHAVNSMQLLVMNMWKPLCHMVQPCHPHHWYLIHILLHFITWLPRCVGNTSMYELISVADDPYKYAY